MGSVVIAAHNEEHVIGRCLDTLLDGASPGEFEVVVVANGCVDATATAAQRPGVLVLDLREAGKAAALNAGDDQVATFPRLYLDADISLSAADARALMGAVGPALAAVPRRRLDVSDRPVAVRAFYAVQGRLPVYERSLFGRGAIALSDSGRARFDRFPQVLADDLFLDSLFTDEERVVVASVTSVVATPRSTADLVRRLARVRRANAQLRGSSRTTAPAGEAPSLPRPSSRWSWVTDVLVPHPRLLPAGVVYAVLTLAAEALARFAPGSSAWGHDRSTRLPATPGAGDRP